MTDPTPPLKLRRRLLWMVSGVAFVGLFWLASQAPEWTEALYGSRIGPWTARMLSLLTGWVPITVFEILIVVLAVRHLRGWIHGVRHVRAKRWKLRHLVGDSFLRIGADAGMLVTAFYLLWGFNYARPSIEARLDWPDGRGAQAEEIARLAEEMVDATNRAYFQLHGTEDAGTPTPFAVDQTQLEQSIREGWSRAAESLGMPTFLGGAYGNPKRFLVRGFLDELGIMGIYLPFTAEPVVNPNAPAVYLPSSFIHEQAHQRGFAPEDEANFMSVFVGMHTPDPLVRYAAYAYIQRQLLSTLAPGDRERWRELQERKHPGVRRDEADLFEYFRSLQSVTNTVTTRVNNAYLRFNRVEGGIRSYGLVVRLLVSWSRVNEGRVLP